MGYITEPEKKESPAQEIVRAFIEKIGLTTNEIAEITGVDSSTARRWLTDENNKSFRKMPYSAWILLNALSDHESKYTKELSIICDQINKRLQQETLLKLSDITLLHCNKVTE